MTIRPKRIGPVALAVLVFGLALVVTVRFTDACRLTTVTLNGQRVKDWHNRYAMLSPTSLVSQPVGQLARSLLARQDVFKVDICYRLPGELDIRTNEFEPVCYVVGEESGKLFGLNRRGRLISLDRVDDIDWERPVFTGLATGSLHTFCNDPRVTVAIAQLEMLRDKRPDLYRLVNELDFSEPDYLRVSVAGLPYYLVLRSDRLVGDLDRFVEFAQKFQPDLSRTYRVDLRYDNMIICAQNKAKKQ